jgi:hypothetical protein
MENKSKEPHHAGDEKLGNEEQQQNSKEPKEDLKLKGLDDKRPADPDLPKGWTPDSDTSRGPQDKET